MNKIFRLIASVLICELAGGAGSVFTAPAIAGWYGGLQKPELAPPNWIFAPVWTTLFLLMGIALYLVWEKQYKRGIVLFFVQLGLNVLWSAIFFGMRNPELAFAEIILLWVAILATIISFLKVSKPAAWLLAPYLLWVTFAAYLNYSLMILN